MNFRLFILISLYSLPCLYTQIQNTESNTELPDPVLPDIDPVISKKKEEYSKFQELIIEFDQSMENMIPDDIISFTLSQDSEEVIMEEFSNVTSENPSVIRGLFFIVTPEEENTKFKILNPKMEVILEITDKLQGAFSINVTENGTFYFVFSNMKSYDSVEITFIFHHFNDLKNIATAKDVNKFELDIYDSLKKLQEVEVNEITMELRQEIYLSNIQLRKKRIYIFTVLETVSIILTTIVQIYFIKKLLDNKIFV